MSIPAVHRRIFAASGLLLLAASPAFALDGGAFGDRLKALYADKGATISWQSIDVQGSNIILRGVDVSAKDLQHVSFGDVTLADVAAGQDGAYRIGTVTVPRYGFSKDDYTLSGSNLVMQGVVLPGPNSDAIPSQLGYDDLALDSISIASKGNVVATATGLHVAVGHANGNNEVTFSGSVGSISADLTKIDDEKAKANVTKLGYEQLHGTAELHGSWTLADGHLVVDRYSLAVDNMGKLGSTLDITGYTPAFIKSMRELQSSLKDQKGEAKGLAMLGLLQQIEIGGFSLRFDDDSLTGRLLDYYANQKKVTRDVLVNQIKGALPAVLARIGDPGFAAKVAQAVGSFLDNPKSIEVKVAPPKPLSIAVIAATGMAQPQALPKTLDLDVVANQ